MDTLAQAQSVTRRRVLQWLLAAGVGAVVGRPAEAFENSFESTALRKKKKAAKAKCFKCRVPIMEEKCTVLKGKKRCRRVEVGCTVSEEVACSTPKPAQTLPQTAKIASKQVRK